MKEIERKEMRLQLNLRSSFKSKVLMRAGLGLDCWSFEPQMVKKIELEPCLGIQLFCS